MKKFVVLLVVVALSCLGTAAFAADIAVSGSIDVRSRAFNNLNLTDDLPAEFSGDKKDTQERVRLTVDAKAGDVKGRISIENDWDEFGRLEQPMADATSTGNAGFLDLREAWVNFNLPGIPVNVNVGHQLLQLGNGWFLRNMKYGDDAWVIANVTGANTIAFVDIKAFEGNTYNNDDIDGYALLDVFKLSDTMAVGIDLTDVKDRNALLAGGNAAGFAKLDLYNIGLNFSGALGPVNLKAELDWQMGQAEALAGGTDSDFKGNQLVIQGNLALDPLTVKFTAARGSGDDNALDDSIDVMQTLLDNDQHYTFLYEYQIGQGGVLHTGFANTTALSVGVDFAVSKSLNVGADFWWLQATEDVADTQNPGGTTSDLGTEIDAHINWAMYDNLSWNWQLGYFMPDDGMGADAATGIQGVLSFKF